jgi:hypothetical protein
MIIHSIRAEIASVGKGLVAHHHPPLPRTHSPPLNLPLLVHSFRRQLLPGLGRLDVQVLDLLHDVLGLLVLQPVLLHKFLDEPELVGPLVVDQRIVLLAAHQGAKVLLSRGPAIGQARLLCLELPSLAGLPSRSDGRLSVSGTLPLASDGGELGLHVLQSVYLAEAERALRSDAAELIGH